MKKLNKIFATMFALALILARPSQTMTAHAQGFVGDWDGGYYCGRTMPDDYWEVRSGNTGSSSSSSDNGSSYSEPSYDSGSSYDGGGSSDDYSYSSSDDSGSSDTASSGTAKAAHANATTGVNASNPDNVTMNVAGGQKFRVVRNKELTAYQVIHCGISRMFLYVKDADGNSVAIQSATLMQGDDNLWYLNFNFAEGVDTTGYTAVVSGVGGESAAYLSTELGVSGIAINGVAALSTVPATDK